MKKWLIAAGLLIALLWLPVVACSKKTVLMEAPREETQAVAKPPAKKAAPKVAAKPKPPVKAPAPVYRTKQVDTFLGIPLN